MTSLKLSGKLLKDVGVLGYADQLHTEGIGSKHYVLAQVVVTNAGDVLGDAEHEAKIAITKMELATGGYKDDAEKLLASIYADRTAGDTLPFTASDDHVRKVAKALSDWAADQQLTDADLRQKWETYFAGESADPSEAPAGPTGAEFAHLLEFAKHVGAIDDLTSTALAEAQEALGANGPASDYDTPDDEPDPDAHRDEAPDGSDTSTIPAATFAEPE